MNMLLSVDFLTPFWENFVVIARNVVFCLILLCAVAIIVSILMQSGNNGGATAVTGITESYYAQNRGSSREGRLQRITTISAIIMVVAIILVFVSCILVPLA